MPSPKITPETVEGFHKDGSPRSVRETITTYIANGAYPHIAGQAAGVGRELFDLWMSRGLKVRGKANRQYRQFREEVLKASARARAKAEIAVMGKKPEKWLLSGPGREKDGMPGWSSMPKPVQQSNTQINMLSHPDLGKMWEFILRTLSAYPEARAAIVDAVRILNADGKGEPPALGS